MWMNLIVIMLSETNQTKKGQTFRDSASMIVESTQSKSSSKTEQGLKRADVSWTQFHLGKLTSHDISKTCYINNWKPYAIEWKWKETVQFTPNSLKLLNRQNAKLYLHTVPVLLMNFNKKNSLSKKGYKIYNMTFKKLKI